MRCLLMAIANLLVLGSVAAAQVSFEQVVENLTSLDPAVRHESVRLLRDAAYPEAAMPLVPLINDQEDAIQLEAIAAELNLFLAQKVVSRRRVALIVERRDRISAENIFTQGAFVLDGTPIPMPVLSALLVAVDDANAQVGREALYAFGVLAMGATGTARQLVLKQAGPALAFMLSGRDEQRQLDAIRVLGRVFARQPGDSPVGETIGDALVVASNRERSARAVAIDAIGALRYDRGVQALSDLLSFYGRGPMAVAALNALAHIAHPALTPRFVESLRSRDAAERRVALEGLGRVKDRTRQALIDESAGSERDASVLLARSFALVHLAEGSLDPIVEAVAVERTRDQAFGYLIELAPGRAAALARHVNHATPDVRIAVADALGFSGDPSAIPVVESLLVDIEPGVAHAAARGLARLRSR